MSTADTPDHDDPQQQEDDRTLFKRLRDRYEGEDGEIVRICDLVVQSDSESEREEAN